MAAIDNLFVQQRSEQSTTSSSYGDVSGTTISAGSFTANKSYLIIAIAALGGTGVNNNEKFLRLVHGTTPTEFEDSEQRVEPVGNSPTQHYGYATVFAQGGTAEKINFQFKGDGSAACEVNELSLYAIQLTDDLSTPADYSQATDSGPDTHDATFTTRATITFTPDNAGDDWLVFASGRFTINNNGKQLEMRIGHGQSDANTPSSSMEPEDTAETWCLTMFRVFNLTAAEHTFTVQTRDDATSGADNVHESSFIIALRLNAFETHGSFWNVAETTADAIPPDDEVANVDLTPATAGDVLVMAQAILDGADADARGELDLIAPTSVEATGFTGTHDATDEAMMVALTRESYGASSQESEALAGSTGTDVAQHRSMVVFSMELSGAAPAPTPVTQRSYPVGHLRGARRGVL